jgi:hypothetical protein
LLGEKRRIGFTRGGFEGVAEQVEADVGIDGLRTGDRGEVLARKSG